MSSTPGAQESQKRMPTQEEFWRGHNQSELTPSQKIAVNNLMQRIVPISSLTPEQQQSITQPLKNNDGRASLYSGISGDTEDANTPRSLSEKGRVSSAFDNAILVFSCLFIYLGSAAIGVLIFGSGAKAAFFGLILGSLSFYGVYHLIIKRK